MLYAFGLCHGSGIKVNKVFIFKVDVARPKTNKINYLAMIDFAPVVCNNYM
jgi:hypothetical protein